MKYQKMHSRHLKAVVEIEDDNYTHPWTYKQFKNRISDELARMYVAIDNDIIIGYMILFREDRGWFIENLTVAREHRRKGIASKFIDLAFKVVHPERINVLVQDRFLPMHLTLKKNGFTATGIEFDDDGEQYYVFVSGD